MRGGFAPERRAAESSAGSGQAPLPRPKTIAFGSMLSGRHDCDYVEITGVVQRAWRPSDPRIHTLFMDVAVEEGVVRAAFWDFAHAGLRSVHRRPGRGCAATSGRCSAAPSSCAASRCSSATPSDIAVLEPPPDPVRAGDAHRPAASTTTPPPAKSTAASASAASSPATFPGHPVEISDFTTTATFRYVRNVLYVDDGTGGARIETEQAAAGRARHRRGRRRVPGGDAGQADPDQRRLQGRREGAAAGGGRRERRERPDAGLRRDAGADAGALPQRAEDAVRADPGAAHRRERLPGDARGRSRRRRRWNSFAPGPSSRSPASTRISGDPRRRSGCSCAPPATCKVIAAAPWWTLRHTGVMIAILALGACAAAFWVRDGREAPAAAVSGGADRAQPRRARAPRHARTGTGGHRAAAGGGRRQPGGVARARAAVAGRRAADAAIQPGGSAAVGDGSARAGAREPRSRRRAHRPGRARRTRSSGVAARVTVEGSPRRLDASDEHHLLRIGLEALTNALKHSGAPPDRHPAAVRCRTPSS